MNKKVCILTSVHPAFDTRIFHKQAKTLVKEGYAVTLIVQHDKDEITDGVKIVALPKPRNRFERMFLGTWRVFAKGLNEKADIYHFHDPELLPVGVLLKLVTKAKVIFDVHENVKWDITTKSWLPKLARKPLSMMYRLTEKLSLPVIDEIIIAEDSYIKNYKKHSNILVLRNYPLLSYIGEHSGVKTSRPTLVYVGGISEARGVLELIQSAKLLKPRYENILLTLVGQIYLASLEEKVHELLEQFDLQDNICLAGQVKHDEIYDILLRCHIGMAVLHPTPNYIESLPTKLFEYMAVGLPVIASDFPVWKGIVEGNNCGLTVNPLDPAEIARAVEYLLEHPEETSKMGGNGRKAVVEIYNWEAESKKLIAVYHDLLKGKQRRQ